MLGTGEQPWGPGSPASERFSPRPARSEPWTAASLRSLGNGMEAELLGWACHSSALVLAPEERLRLLCRGEDQGLAPAEVGAGLEPPEPQQGGRAAPVPQALWGWLRAPGVLASCLSAAPHLLERRRRSRPDPGPLLGACCPCLPVGRLAPAQECTLASWLSNVTVAWGSQGEGRSPQPFPNREAASCPRSPSGSGWRGLGRGLADCVTVWTYPSLCLSFSAVPGGVKRPVCGGGAKLSWEGSQGTLRVAGGLEVQSPGPAPSVF